jgi:folate-binding protein YgfZ
MQGYEAMREHSAWLDLSGRGRIRATGEDRVRLLHAMSSNHIQQLEAGSGCYAFFLNPQGRILSDAVILAASDALAINTEPETRESLLAHLNKHIIADDVTLEDTTAETVQIGVEGPASEQVLSKLGAPVPAAPYSHQAWQGGFVIRFSTTGQPGFSIIAPAAMRDTLIGGLEASGCVEASAEAARVVRLELGRPRYGEDITDRYLPHETQLLSAVHFNKGCYIGQEIVERVRSRGGVHRFLVRLEIEGEEPPASGTKITAGGREVGEITSAAYSPARRSVMALGYVRMNEVTAGTALEAGGRKASVAAGKPLGSD